MAEQTTAQPTPSRARRIFDEIKGLLVTGGLMLFAGTAIGQPFIVPSGSMEPTLMIGDEIAAAKYAYGYGRYSAPIGVIPIKGRVLDSPPERGDIVVFALPRDPKQTYVKRLIGLPGETVQMKGGQLYINGERVERRPAGRVTVAVGGVQVPATRYIETLPNGREHPIFKFRQDGELDNTQEFHVGAGQIFVMGDNRDDSADSRLDPAAGGVGYVPVENLVGRVEAVLGSWDPAVRRDPLWTWPAGLRFSRFFSRVN